MASRSLVVVLSPYCPNNPFGLIISEISVPPVSPPTRWPTADSESHPAYRSLSPPAQTAISPFDLPRPMIPVIASADNSLARNLYILGVPIDMTQ